MARNVRLDHSGMAAVAKSGAVAHEITALAERIAANVRAQNIHVEGVPGDVLLPVEVTSYTTDRARSSVTIKHASGLAVQAKHGALTKAAAQAGLEVSGEGPDDLIEYTTKRGVTRTATRAQVANWTRGSL